MDPDDFSEENPDMFELGLSGFIVVLGQTKMVWSLFILSATTLILTYFLSPIFPLLRGKSNIYTCKHIGLLELGFGYAQDQSGLGY